MRLKVAAEIGRSEFFDDVPKTGEMEMRDST